MTHAIVLDEDFGFTCRHCGGHIILDMADQWVHRVEANTVPGHPEVQAGYGTRGCRAASYVRGSGWNDDLNPRWMAKP